MIEILIGAGGALLGVVLLHIFFRVAESKWPQSYYSIADLLSYRISSSPLKYSLFRFGPTLIVTFFLTASLLRTGQDIRLPVGLLIAGHIALTSARGLVHLLRIKSAYGFELRLIAHLVVTIGVILSAGLGIALASYEPLQSLVPTADELPQSLWTAGLAAIVGVFLLEATKGSSLDAADLLKNSQRSIPEDLWNHARALAEAHNADPALVRAILAVENLQRPAWLRTLELWKGRVWRRGSYGIMQVQADKPLTDLESLELAVRDRLANVTVDWDEYGPDYESLQRILVSYNADPRFVDMAKAFYEELAGPSDLESESESPSFLGRIDWEEASYQAVPVATGFLLGSTLVLLVGAMRRLRKKQS